MRKSRFTERQIVVILKQAEAGVSMTGKRVARALERLSLDHPLPRVISVDNGSEFYSRAMDSWAYRRGVQETRGLEDRLQHQPAP